MKSACSEDFKTVLTLDQVEAEIIEVKDTRGHFQFAHFYARFFPVLAVRITLLYTMVGATNVTQCLTDKY